MECEAYMAFQAYWSKLFEAISDDSEYKEASQSISWLQRVMKENVPFGKQTRALMLISLYQEMKPVRTPQDDELSFLVAWCLEIMQASFLIADDIMDGSTSRRGRTCWYLVPDVGPMALNDVLLLENLVYQLLSRYVKDKEVLLKLMQLLQKTSYQTILGQGLDLRMGVEKHYSKFNEDMFSNIVKYKTSYYTFYQPAAAAAIMAGISDQNVFGTMKNISEQVGHFFQVQDDYMDCFVSPEVSGKVGTDIIDGKCTWLAVTALSVADEKQRKAFTEHYGSPDPIDVQTIKDIYMELNIPQAYRKYELMSYKNILNSIRLLGDSFPQKTFISILNSIYERNKFSVGVQTDVLTPRLLRKYCLRNSKVHVQ